MTIEEDDEYHEELYIGRSVDTDYLDSNDDLPSDEYAFDDGRDPECVADMDRSHEFGIYGGTAAKSGLDELKDGDAIIDHDGRSDTRTFFYVDDRDVEYASKKQRDMYQRLIRHQEGIGDPERSIHNYKADRRRMIHTFTNQCELSRHQSERVQEIIDSISINTFGHYSTESVIVAAISLAANEEGRVVRDEDTFIELTKAIGMDYNKLRRVRQLIREKSALY